MFILITMENYLPKTMDFYLPKSMDFSLPFTFCLNVIEKDIIEKHMWPLTIRLPKYKESFIVSFVDKYCSTAEIFNLRDRNNSDRFIRKLLSRCQRETYEL